MVGIALFALVLVSIARHDDVVEGFTPFALHRNNIHLVELTKGQSFTRLYAQGDENVETPSKLNTLDEKVRTKLLAETIAPWRAVRLFAYGTLGGGALIGGLITVTSTAAVVAGARTDLELNTCLTNLAIDFGAVAFFAVLAKFDLDKKKELDERVEERIQTKKKQKQMLKEMKERDNILSGLKLDIQYSADGAIKEALIRDLQGGARQHVILVIGPKKACRDALVGANLLKMDFAMKNILVVPYDVDDQVQSRSSGGFGERPLYETQPYVARPTASDSAAWKEYCNAELNDAVKQNGEKAREEGIVLVVASNGKVIRRGVGKIPWRQMVKELDEAVKQ